MCMISLFFFLAVNVSQMQNQFNFLARDHTCLMFTDVKITERFWSGECYRRESWIDILWPIGIVS